MSAGDILHEMERRGIRLMPNGGRLEFEPASRLTEADIERLRRHKAELLQLLTAPKATELGCWRCGSSSEPIGGQGGLWCPACERLAWRFDPGGAIVRSDQEPVDFEALPPMSECPQCGGILWRWDSWGGRHCAACDPGQSDRLIALAELLRERAHYRP